MQSLYHYHTDGLRRTSRKLHGAEEGADKTFCGIKLDYHYVRDITCKDVKSLVTCSQCRMSEAMKDYNDVNRAIFRPRIQKEEKSGSTFPKIARKAKTLIPS